MNETVSIDITKTRTIVLVPMSVIADILEQAFDLFMDEQGGDGDDVPGQ